MPSEEEFQPWRPSKTEVAAVQAPTVKGKTISIPSISLPMMTLSPEPGSRTGRGADTGLRGIKMDDPTASEAASQQKNKRRPPHARQGDYDLASYAASRWELADASPGTLGEAIQAAASPTSSTGSPQKGQMQTSTIPSHPSASPECEDGRTSRGLLLLPQDITTQKKLQAAADQQKKDRQHAISPRNTHRTDAPFASSAHQPTRTSPRGTSSSPSAGVRGMLQSGYKISDTKGGQHEALMLLEQKVEVQRDEIIKLKETLQLQSAVQRAELQTVLQEFETFKSAFRAELMSDFRRLNAAYVSPPPPLASTPRHRGDTNGNIATINGGLGAMSRSLSSPVSSPHDVKMTLNPKPKSGHGSLHHPRSADQASASQQGCRCAIC